MSIFSLKNHLFILIILRILWKKKRPNRLVESFWCVSAALSSRTASRRVFSAPHSLTSVFGMGTGGPYALWALTCFRCLLSFGSCLSLRQTSYFAVCFLFLCLSASSEKTLLPTCISTRVSDFSFALQSLRAIGGRHRLLVHLQGFEPGTHWLRVSCSTNWAKGAYSFSVLPFLWIFFSEYPLKTK